MSDINAIVERWVQVWHEADPAARRKTITELWANNATEVTTTAEFHGHDELFDRVTSAYEEFVGTGEYVFVSAGDVASHHDMVVFTTHMLASGADEVLWQARIVLQLNADGQIQREDQVELQTLSV
jgi:hypothetical protein